MPTTSNFGWTTPADTDLVKDGALAIRTLGNGIDTSMAELKGGTTGQVLSKTSNTDMDFTWVTTDDANAIQNAIVDAKGDLIAASANDTPARLAVGNNGETLLADSATTTGLRWQPAKSVNYIINGGFDFWQRATSATFTPTASVPQYNSADRFWFAATGTPGSLTVSRQTADTAALQYGLRFGRASGTTQTGGPYLGTNIESQQMKLLAGKAVVLSFYAKKGADFSYTPTVQLFSGTGTDQAPVTLFNGSYTGSNNFINATFSPTTTMARYTFTGTVPSTANELAFSINWTPSGTAGANEWLQIEGLQLELGSVATEFARSGGTLAGELAACQRYYYREGGDQIYQGFATGYAESATAINYYKKHPVTMRVAPSTFEYSTVANYQTAVAAITSNFTQNNAGKDMSVLRWTAASGATIGQVHNLVAYNSTSAYVGFSAEL